jgi:hypothetical protein
MPISRHIAEPRAPRPGLQGTLLLSLALCIGSSGAFSGPSSFLSNISVRSNAGSGSQNLIAGFVVAGTGSESVLVRGDGPSLSQFGIAGALADPVLSIFNSSAAEIATGAAWGGSTLLSDVFSQVGAFPLPTASNDSALEETLPAGSYTAQITSAAGNTGEALLEVYDADTGAPTARFTNLSARSEVGTGALSLVAGFVVAGTSYETVLIRGSGPALGAFGVSGVLASPQLTLYDSGGNVIATNTGWANFPASGNSAVQATVFDATAAIFSQVGAFQFPANSPDCALVATLPPGTYSVNVSGTDSTTGVALVEVYELADQGRGEGAAPVFTLQPLSQTIDPGGSYAFTVSVSGPSTFQWYLNGSAIPGATTAGYVASQGGSYDVVATNTFGSTTSNAATLTVGAASAAVTDLANASGQVYYVTFDGSILQALGTMQQHLGIEVGFSWDSEGMIHGSASSSAGPNGATFTTHTNGSVGVGPGSGATNSKLQFDWIYFDSAGTLISVYFDGVYYPPPKGQSTGSFAGIASVVYSTVAENDFTDSGFVATFSPEPPTFTSF